MAIATDTERNRPPAAESPLAGLDPWVDVLRETGAEFYRRGWSLGTSSNYSAILNRHGAREVLVTASGKDKGRLSREDFVRVDLQGRPVVPGQPKSSAETLLHCVLAQELPDVGSVLHTHSLASTLLSDHYFNQGHIEIAGFEMLKGLSGITTHQTAIQLEIFENTQDIPVLAEAVRQRLRDPSPLRHGYLIRKHGLYTWGADVLEARRHIEILEFLLECVARTTPNLAVLHSS